MKLDFLKHKYFKFGVAAALYILFVIWLGNYWFLFGLPVVFDIYISKIIPNFEFPSYYLISTK